MGGYAAYVWSAYGITLVILVVSAWTARRLGLNAEARSEPFETIVIDQIELPDAN
jgi:heme exporter protein D